MPTNSSHTRVPSFCRTLLSIRPGDPGYPPAATTWQAWHDPGGLFPDREPVAGPALAAIGQLNILTRPSIGLLCSIRCPGNLILTTYDFAKKTPQDGATIIGGFHSPMERTCLATLLARHVPVVYCPGRRLNEKGIPHAYDPALAEGRLVIVSPFVDSQRHVTRDLAQQRNQFVAALANVLFVPYAMRGGKAEAVVRMCLQQGKPAYTLADGENKHLVDVGAYGITLEELLELAANPATGHERGRILKPET